MLRWQPTARLSRYGLGVPDQRSAHPDIPGVPPWTAVLIAVSATLAGFAIEAGLGHQELGFIFAAFYAIGCIAAVLAVRHSGIFTAVIQPPLLLFVAVPLAYFLFHGSSFTGLKDILISCGYPLIERFPLMLFTSAAVLLIGMGRWWLAMGRDNTAAADRNADTSPGQPGMLAGLAAKFASFSRPATDREPRHGARVGRPPRQPRPERPPRAQRPADPTRSRRARSDEYDGYAPRPRRQAPRGSMRDHDPRDRPRRPREGERRTPPPSRRDPRERSRDDRYDAPRAPYRDPYRESHRDPYDYPSEPPRRRPAPGNSNGTHHPVSRVRYRSDELPEDRRRRER